MASKAKLKPPVRLVRGPRVRIDRATSSRSHRDRADLGTHLSPEHRNSYVRDSDVHQPIRPLRDNNITEALYPPGVNLSTPNFLPDPRSFWRAPKTASVRGLSGSSTIGWVGRVPKHP
jgi:hypothetical protein